MPIYKIAGRKDGQQKYKVRVNYIDNTGRSKQTDRIAYGMENAKMLEAKLLSEFKETAPDDRITVKQLYDEYTNAKKIEVRETTLNKTKQILSNHVLPMFKSNRLKTLTLQSLQKWKLYIEGKKLSATTKKNIFGEFRAMLNYAVKFGYISSNPLSKLGNFKNAYEGKKTINYYTSDEFLKFISASKDHIEKTMNDYEWNYYVFFCIAFYTGMRKGEINALKWTDVDNGYIHVSRSIAQKLSGDDRETPPKNKSSIRTLQIPKPLQNTLDEHRAHYEAIENFCDDWRICGGPQCLRDTTIDKYNELYAKLAGIKKIRIHDFRHSHASLLANEGINIQEIARRLGHSKIEITWNTYSHLYPREEERAVNILNKISLNQAK